MMRIVAVSILMLFLFACTERPKAVVLKRPSAATYAQADQGNEGTGNMELGWFMEYAPLKYYGFDQAAEAVTEHFILKVKSCPYSAKVKSDLFNQIAALQQVYAYEVQIRFPMAPAVRPDFGNDHPSRSYVAKMPKNVSQLTEFYDTEDCDTGLGGGL